LVLRPAFEFLYQQHSRCIFDLVQELKFSAVGKGGQSEGDGSDDLVFASFGIVVYSELEVFVGAV
jgi:hypothetical protein